MSTAKVLINAQWRPEHFATPVFPGFKATPLAQRMVPSTPAVSFINVIAPSTTVTAQDGHKLFLLRSIAQDLSKFTQFKPDEAAESDPVEGSPQCVHGNTGIIFPLPPGKWPIPPLPGAINCGVIPSKDVDCLINLQELIEQIADRLLDELSSPWTFYNNYNDAYNASMQKWLKDLPGNVADGVVNMVKGLGTAVAWVGKAAWEGTKAVGHAVLHPVETYDAVAQAAQEAADFAKTAYDILSDPESRAALAEELKNWLKEQLADLACDAAALLQEALNSGKSMAAFLGETKASVEQVTLEIAGQVAVTALGDKGLSKVGMLVKGGAKLGGMTEGIGKLLARMGKRLENLKNKLPGKSWSHFCIEAL